MDPVKAEFGLNPSTEAPSNMIVLTIAAYSNQEADNLPPLYHSIDPDALDSVLDSMKDVQISFSYAGHRVSVNASSDVSIEPLSE